MGHTQQIKTRKLMFLLETFLAGLNLENLILNIGAKKDFKGLDLNCFTKELPIWATSMPPKCSRVMNNYNTVRSEVMSWDYN